MSEVIVGDLNVGRDIYSGGNANIAGNATIKRNLKVEGWLDAKNIKGTNKGLYASIESLKTTHPTPEDGWWALVGDSIPAQVYRAIGGTWESTGEMGGGLAVELNDYISKDALEEKLGNYSTTESLKESYPWTIEQDSKVFAVRDAKKRLLFWVNEDGSFEWAKGVPSHIMDVIKDVQNNSSVAIKDILEDYVELTIDVEGRILGGRKLDGTRIEQKIEAKKLEITKSFNIKNEALTDLEKILKSRGFGSSTMDWSDSKDIIIPNEPQLGLVNLTNISVLPTTKKDNLKGVVEFWDLQGNYFKKKGILNAQGSSSMFYPKKNLAIDFVEDEWVGDETPSIKIGKWVAQDSFHIKAYYNDGVRGVCAVAYKIWEQVKQSRGIFNDRPYKRLYVNEYTDKADGYHEPSEFKKNYPNGARCFPDGFPMLLFLNGEFYGVYSWQLKKHRDNMMQNKKTAEHIHLDLGTSAPWDNTSGTLDWTTFEVRNPKSLFYQVPQMIDGVSTLEYDGDAPAEILGEDSSYYDASNKDHVRCAKVKKYILQTRAEFAELQQLKENGGTEEEIRAKISSMFDVDSIIDYNIMIGVCGNGDSQKRNVQWTTWDGKMWNPNPYDWDSIFGIGLQSVPRDAQPFCYFMVKDQKENMPYWWVHTYFFEEEKARYHELRSLGIISTKNFVKEISGWMERVGAQNYEREFEKWNESPVWRDSLLNGEYWELADQKKYSSVPTDGEVFDVSKNYAIGDVCYYGQGNEIWMFKSIQASTAKPPLTGFYSASPTTMGYHESIYRINNWVDKILNFYDSNKGYDYQINN